MPQAAVRIEVQESLGNQLDRMVNRIRMWSSAEGRGESIGYIKLSKAESREPTGDGQDVLDALQEVEATITGFLKLWDEKFFGHKQDEDEKKARIRQLYKAGVPAELISLSERVTVRWVRYIVGEASGQRKNNLAA